MLFTVFKILRWRIEGGFDKNLYLRKHFSTFLALYLASVGGVAYSATISYDYWLYNSNSQPIALTVTILLAVLASILIGACMGMFANLKERSRLERLEVEEGLTPIQERRLAEMEESGQFNYVIIVVTALIMCTDMWANYHGAPDLALRMSDPAPTLDLSAEEESFRAKIATLEGQKKAILDRYTWKGRTYFAPTKYHPKSEVDRDKKAVQEIESAIAATTAANAKLTERRTMDYSTAAAGWQEKLGQRTSSHRHFVFVIYFLVLLIGYFNSDYVAKAIEWVEHRHLRRKKSARVDTVTSLSGGSGETTHDDHEAPRKEVKLSPETMQDVEEALRDLWQTSGEQPSPEAIGAYIKKSSRTVQRYLKKLDIPTYSPEASAP